MNKNTKQAKKLNRQLSKQKSFMPANPVPFGRCVNSSLERKHNGKKPWQPAKGANNQHN